MALSALTTALVGSTVVGSPGGAAAQVGDEPTAIVAMGDSYLSGEAARWAGNSADQFGDREGTDRAYRGLLDYDVDSVYVDGTNASGCHRAAQAPIDRVYVRFDAKINLACSGARTVNVIGAAVGGRSLEGEAPQVDQLAEVASTHAVELVVLSVGGNDLGFGDMILDCTVAYTASLLWWREKCADDKQADVDAAMVDAMAGVAAALEGIRSTLDDHGDDGARIVLASYPSPVPRGADLRYGNKFSRTFIGGCPFWASDTTWARDTLVPQIAAELRAVARDARVELLDLQDLLEGREICAEGVEQSDGTPSDRTDEWARFVTTGILQGEAQESLHPNFFGQRAVGRCIELVLGAEPGEWACTNRPGAGARSLDLTRL